MTLTYNLDPDMVKVNQHAKYLHQWSFLSKIIARTRTHAQRTEWAARTRAR